MRLSKMDRLLSFAALAAGVFLSGCATNQSVRPVAAVAGMSGAVHGGQQPISGATIQLYTPAVDNSGRGSTPLLSAPVLSDAGGNFNITGLYTCPSADSLVYLTATGGSPGTGIANPQIALMAAMGPCGSLTPSTFINVNELTTVAAVYALAPYMGSYADMSPGYDGGIANAFAYSGYLANTTTGTVPGLNVPAGYSVPIAQMNTVADLLAACINSGGGVSGDPSICGQFFALTLPTPSSVVSTDTIGALLHLAQNPSLNTAALFNLIPASSPFQPTDVIVPSDFAVRLLFNSPFTVAPSSLSFAPAVIYAPQPAQTLTVTNGTAAAVNITSAALIGVNASDFAISATTCGSAVPANSTCTYQISFSPTGIGARAAYFVLGNSTPNPSIAIALSGSGTAAPANPVTLTPGSATFPTTNAGSSSPITFTLANSGSADALITAFSSGNPAFTLTFNCPGLDIPAGGTCTVTVTFSPTTAGPQSGTLSFQYFSAGTTMTVAAPISGLGTAPTLQFSSSSLTFPATPVGTAAQAQTLTLSNYGTGPASNLVATFNGAGAASFSQTNNCPAMLAVNASCVFTVNAAPTQTGPNVANLVVSAAGASGLLTTMVTGTPGTPSNNPLVLSDSQLYVPSGGSTVLTLTNTGNGEITFAAFNVSTSFSQTNTCGLTLAAGATCNVQLNAATVPVLANPVSGTLTISSNAQTLVETVPLYTADASHVYDFGNSVVGYPAPGLFVTSCGSGCNVRTIIAGPNPGDFPYLGPSSCGGRAGCSVSTLFVPTATGRRIATSDYPGCCSDNQTLLIGTGIPATGAVTSFSISAASIDFGTYIIGYALPQPQTITLTNTGNQPVPIKSIYTNSAFFSGYQFPETNTCGTSLAVGSTCTITVSFHNFYGGLHAQGDLILSTYSLTPGIDIPLSADPVSPQQSFTLSSTSVTLGQTPAGTPSSAQSVTLTNTGNVPESVTVGPYTSGGANFSFTTTCGTVAAGGTCTITVNGTPPAAGTFSDVLPVAVMNVYQQQSISVSVTGY